MEYSFAVDAEFLRARVSGRDTDRAPSEFCAAVLEETARTGRMRVLIELDQQFPLSPGSQQELVENLPKLGFTSRHSIALVHRSPIAKMAYEFVNVVAAERDVMVRNFPDVEAAKGWLRTRPA